LQVKTYQPEYFIEAEVPFLLVLYKQ